MSLITIPNVFSAGAVIIASQHNSNFSVIVSDYNGNVTNDNIATNAAIAYSKLNLTGSIINADVGSGSAIAYSKLNLTGSIVNADINASAAIVDTKLAQITTASKVSGTAITGLASLPSGAGIIPTANLPALGANTFISVTTISGAATTGSIAITSGQTYLVQFNFINPTGSADLLLRFNTDTGSNYKYSNLGLQAGSATVLTHRSTGTTSISLLAGTAITQSSTSGVNGSLYIQQLGASSQIYRIWGNISYDDNVGNIACSTISGSWFNTANVTSFAILPSTGNIDGSVYLYKLQLS